jgi:hypothetical protein
MSEKPEMKRSKSALAKARLQEAVAAQEKRLNESWYGKMIPNDYEEYRKLVDPRPEELANSLKLEVLGRTVTVTCVSPRRAMRAGLSVFLFGFPSISKRVGFGLIWNC